MKFSLAAAVGAFAAVGAALPTGATSVAANNPALTSLGSFGAGSYLITATGLVDLVGPVSSGFTIRPDGIPDSPVTTPGYGYFNPSGSDIADGNYGAPGPGFKIGSLVGTLTATPGTGDWFTIGYAKAIVLTGPTTIYALVNDTFYPNDYGAFDVSVAAVPEPASWALLIAGFGLSGAALRRRRAVAAA